MTDFTRRVRDVVSAVPRGRVVTYGQVAALAGNVRGARGVAWILHSSSEAVGLPWHRVVNARGGISLPPGRGFEEQRRRLTAEGVIMTPDGRVDLRRFGWEPPGGRSSFMRAAEDFVRGLEKSDRARKPPRPGRIGSR